MRYLRLLDFGGVSPLRSQTLYHTVCQGVSQGEPETLLLMYPKRPYVCVGYHSNIEREIDLTYCRRRRLPVYRRQTGGGPVYLDKDQLFFQLILHEKSVPLSIKRAYAELLEAPVRTYRALGLDARLETMNDICVDGRKISGTAMAKIEDAVVLVGNIIFDFDYEAMVRVLNLPNDTFREQVATNLDRYLTALKRELPSLPRRAEVKRLLVEEWRQLLEAELIPATLSPYEEEVLTRWDRQFRTKEWLNPALGGSSDIRRVKIRSGVAVAAAHCRIDGTALGMVASFAQGRISALNLSPRSGNGSAKPALLNRLQTVLINQQVDRDQLLERSRACLQELGLVADPAEMVDTIVAAATVE
ncbi:MAG: biotin/lipoate A/B protein ligase family protein [Dehalococcoidia bacterium]